MVRDMVFHLGNNTGKEKVKIAYRIYKLLEIVFGGLMRLMRD